MEPFIYREAEMVPFVERDDSYLFLLLNPLTLRIFISLKARLTPRLSLGWKSYLGAEGSLLK